MILDRWNWYFCNTAVFSHFSNYKCVLTAYPVILLRIKYILSKNKAQTGRNFKKKTQWLLYILNEFFLIQTAHACSWCSRKCMTDLHFHMKSNIRSLLDVLYWEVFFSILSLVWESDCWGPLVYNDNIYIKWCIFL
jgi:hypothetical protein